MLPIAPHGPDARMTRDRDRRAATSLENGPTRVQARVRFGRDNAFVPTERRPFSGGGAVASGEEARHGPDRTDDDPDRARLVAASRGTDVRTAARGRAPRRLSEIVGPRPTQALPTSHGGSRPNGAGARAGPRNATVGDEPDAASRPRLTARARRPRTTRARKPGVRAERPNARHDARTRQVQRLPRRSCSRNPSSRSKRRRHGPTRSAPRSSCGFSRAGPARRAGRPPVD
jgi:hypothetical protein